MKDYETYFFFTWVMIAGVLVGVVGCVWSFLAAFSGTPRILVIVGPIMALACWSVRKLLESKWKRERYRDS
jgi:hypothetical protein